MTIALDGRIIERLRAVVAGKLGLQFDDSKVEFLSAVMQQRIKAVGQRSPEHYLRLLELGDARAELGKLAERLTVGETYFFRNTNDIRAFTEVVLPDCTERRASSRRLRMLSAGCSTGEEAYSLAMLIRQRPQFASWDVTIHAVDVNPAAIARARSARYSEWALRQTPPAVQSRFFRQQGREFVLERAVREMVTFEEANLVADIPSASAYDIVFCRNVIMYFTPDQARRAIERIVASLAPAGYLFLGHAETLRGISTAFHLRHTNGAFYYQLRDAADRDGAVEVRTPPVLSPHAESLVPLLVEQSASWVDAIHSASTRIARLSAEGMPPAAPARTDAAPLVDVGPRASHVARALELLHRERYEEALGVIGDSPDADRDPDALLLRAVLLAIGGSPAESEGICARILTMNELSAEAHYVMALCREHAGDAAGAVSHDQYAVYLDPSFAMPRLHLGLMARRAGHTEAARRELRRALVLLSSEETSRVLLLGGGFTRDALMDLCRAELRGCGAVA